MLFLLLGACVSTPSTPPAASGESPASSDDAAESAVPAAPWSVVVADGSNNVTRVQRGPDEPDARWSYDPMTPERSSSGTYSGGDPAEGVLDDAAVTDLWVAVDAALSDESGHAEARAMGTVSLTVTRGGDTQTVVLDRQAGATLLETLPSH